MADKEAAREELAKFKKRINKIYNMKDTKARSAAVLEVLEEYRSGQLDYLFQDNTAVKEFVKSVMKELHVSPASIHSTSKTSDDVKNKATDPKFRTSIVDNLMKALLVTTNVPGDKNLSNVELVVNGIAGAVITGDSAGLQQTVEAFVNNPENTVKQMKAFQKEITKLGPTIKNVSEALYLALETATQTLQTKIDSNFYAQGRVEAAISQATGRIKDGFKRIFYKADKVTEAETPVTALVPVDQQANADEIAEIEAADEEEKKTDSTALVPAGETALSTDVTVPIDLDKLFEDMETGRPVKRGGFKRFFEKVRTFIVGKYAQFVEFLESHISVEKLKDYFSKHKKDTPEAETEEITEETGLEVLQAIGAFEIFDKDKNWLSSSSIPAGIDIRNPEDWAKIKEAMDQDGNLFKKGNTIFVHDGHTVFSLDPETFELTDLSKNMGRQSSDGPALLTDGTEPQMIDVEFEIIDENNKTIRARLSEFLDKLGSQFKKLWEQLKTKWENRKTRQKDKSKDNEEPIIDEDRQLPPGKTDEEPVDDNEDELDNDDPRPPKPRLRDRLKNGFKKIGNPFKKRVKEERETFKSNDYLDAINKYLERVEPARVEQFKDIAGFISSANFEEKKNNNLKNALINIKSIIDAYIERVEQAKVPYGKYPPAEGLLAAIELECQKIQTNDAVKVDAPEQEERPAKQNNIIANVTAIRAEIESYDVDPDTKKKVRFLFEESLRTAGYDESNPEETAKRFKKWFGIKPDMSMDDMLTKIQEFSSSPRAFTRDKKAQDVYKAPIHAFKDFYAQTAPGRQQASNVKMISEAEFVSKYARSIALGIINDELSASVDEREGAINDAAGRTYRSIKLNNRKLLKNIAENTRAIAARCNMEANAIMAEFQNGLVQGHDGLVVTDDMGEVSIDLSKLSEELLKQVQDEVRKIIDEVSLLPNAEAAMESLFDEMSKEKGETERESQEPPVVEMTDLMGEFNAFVKGNDDREKAVVDYGASYTIDIAGGFGVVETMYLDQFEDLKNIALNPDMDKAAKTTAITKAIKANQEMMATFTELAGAENVDKFVDAFVSHMVDMYITKSGIETVIDDFNKGKEEQNQVKDPKLFADKVACAQAITGLQGKADLSPDEQKLLNSLRTEYYNILQKEIALGIELSDSDKKFIETYEKSKVPTPTNDGGDHDYTYDLTNFEKGYAEWKELADKKAKGVALDSNEEEAAKLEAKYQKFIDDNLKEIVKKVQSCGSQFTDDQEPTGGEQLTDDERAFLGANAAEVGALIKDKTQHNDFCKGIIAQGKAVPNITAEKVQGDDGKVTYSLSIHAQKTYEELFPSTDISAKIAKTVKDLKDAYVYLKPGIKLCDKLIDYIKTLNFDVPTTTNTGDMPEKTEDDPTKIPSTPETPSTDKDKLEALLKEINDKLEDLKKAVEMAGKGIESEKMKGMELSGDILAKLTDVNKIITKEGQDKDIVTTYTPRYMDASSALYNYHSQLLGMGQLQIPATPIGNGMYAIPGNMLGFLSMANQQMFGAAYAGFMGLDPQMYSKMYAQMRPTFTTSITVLGSKGEKVTMKVKLAAGLINDSQVNLFKKDIHDHIFNFLETKSNDIDAIKGDLTTYLEEILPGSVIEQSTLTNVMTGEITTAKQDPVVKSSEIVTPAGSKENAQVVKKECSYTYANGTVSLVYEGKVVAHKTIEGRDFEKMAEQLEKDIAEINRSSENQHQKLIDMLIKKAGLTPGEPSKEMGQDD